MPNEKRSKIWIFSCFACAMLAAGAAGIHSARGAAGQKENRAATAGSAIHFEDVTHAAGIHFTHNTGAFGKKWLPETMGPGVGFIDYDNDGWQDIVLVNGRDWPEHARKRSTLAVYHNNQNGTFTDVTEKAGLAVEMYGMEIGRAHV